MSKTEAWEMCPTLGVRDVRTAVDHFVKRLGFEALNVIEGVAPGEGAVYAILARGGAELHLQIRRRPIWSGERESIEGDVYVRVPDVDAVHEELVSRGANILRPPEDEPYGMRDFVVEGPEGHRLGIGSPLGG